MRLNISPIHRSSKFALLLMALFSFGLSSQAQTLIYDGFIKGHKVGEMKVTKETNDEGIKINVDTKIEAHLIVKIRVDFKSESTYMNNSLVEASAETYTNGHLKHSVKTFRNDGTYRMDKDGKKKALGSDDLIGADMYYFELPHDGEEVFALATGIMLHIEKDGENRFFFEHDGKKELHTFKDGVLEEVEISHRLYTITFKRQH